MCENNRTLTRSEEISMTITSLVINERKVEVDVRPTPNPRMKHGRAYLFNEVDKMTVTESRDIIKQVFDHVQQMSGQVFTRVYHVQAGCVCGCSPGWILKGYTCELFITIN
jgi:hypothetical protein